MKRRDIVLKLLAAGFTLKEGASHTKIYKDGVKVSVLARHTEINERTVRSIEQQTGVTLR